jgi:chemotaxis protein CheD
MITLGGRQRSASRLGTGPIVHTLHPGDVACGDRDDRLETLLGSCVAIVLTDPRRTIGTMCHIVHSAQAPSDTTRSAAYADVAFETMFGLLRARGITPGCCEAYVYGGGNMFPNLVRNSHVGDNNARWALDALCDAGIEVLHQDLGGSAYRRLSWTVGPDAPNVTAVPMW